MEHSSYLPNSVYMLRHETPVHYGLLATHVNNVVKMLANTNSKQSSDLAPEILAKSEILRLGAKTRCMQ